MNREVLKAMVEIELTVGIVKVKVAAYPLTEQPVKVTPVVLYRNL